MINHSHRLSAYDPKKPNSLGLHEAVEDAKLRALSVVYLLQQQFTGEDISKVNDEIIYSSLDVIEKELCDIGSLIKHFHEAEKTRS